LRWIPAGVILTQDTHDILSTTDFGSEGLVAPSKCFSLGLKNLFSSLPHHIDDISASSEIRPEHAEEVDKRPLESGWAKMSDLREHLETPEIELLLGRARDCNKQIYQANFAVKRFHLHQKLH
jgi:hypothetical protein